MERRVALLSGHIYLVNGYEWQALPEFAWSEAYSKGCVSEDMFTGGGVNIPPELLKGMVDEAGLIEELEGAIKDAITVNAQDAFYKGSGDPKTNWFAAKLAKNVTKEQVMKAWFNVQNGE